MNVLSLFNGMNCGYLSLHNLGIKINKYYSSEIDTHAIKVAQTLFPDTIQLGDVTKWREWDIEWDKIDILIGGSPCQGFSFAGKQLAFDDPRSALFFVFVKIWEHIKKVNPKAYFLLENVRMKEEHENVISNYMEVKPILINSALLSAQNRNRLYWTNLSNEPYGLFGYNHCTIPQPKDKGILLKDVLEKEVDEKYFLSDKMINSLLNNQTFNKFNPKEINFEGKSSCLTARTHKMGNADNYIKIDKKGNVKNNQNKASCFTAGGNSGGNHSDMDLIVITHSTQPRTGKGKGGKGRLFKTDQKSYCLDTTNSQAVEFTKNYLQFDVSGKGHKSQQDRAFYLDGKHGCLATARADTKTGVLLENRIRRLTPKECMRLQTIPEWAIEKMLTCGVSDTQLYRMLGNGWTVDVISYILSYMK
jgi:DNA-cytosine methyltransferase